MTGIFRRNNPLNTFLLLVYGLLLKFVWLIHPQIPVIHQSDGFLFNNFISIVTSYFASFPKIWFFIAFLLLFSQAIYFNQIITRRRMMQKPNYLPAMSYLLTTSFFPEWNVVSASLIINSVILWVWSKISNINNSHHPKSTLFNVGIGIGICSFLYLSSLAFTIFVILALVILRPPKVAEWLITIIGVLVPWYFLAAWLFFTNKLYSFRFSGYGISQSGYHLLYNEWGGIAFITIIILTGAFFIRYFMKKQILQVRKNWGLLLLYLLVGTGIPFIILHQNIGYWILALLPGAAFVGCAFYYPRIKWIPMVIQWGMVAFVIYMEYF